MNPFEKKPDRSLFYAVLVAIVIVGIIAMV